MKIPEIFRKKKEDGKPVFSLEVFPPKRKKNKDSIYEAFETLKVTDPDFISVTYGAGGNIADNSACDIAANIKKVRLKQNMSQLELADKSGVSISSIKRMEDGELKNFESIIRALRTLGMLDVFIPLVEDEQLSPNEYYELVNKINKRNRKRASKGYVKDKKEEF